ncbi:hypothetical protein OIU35_31490 [Boseaceae bacterium BT-24-1]|nr:hypothetical protein [Boseaceae bacterium BT-24-1]
MRLFQPTSGVGVPEFCRNMRAIVERTKMRADEVDALLASLRQPRRSGGRVAPTEAQKEAGNYPKERVSFQGLPISIETKKGQVRTGRGPTGKRWSCRLPADYGYIRRTEGADGDHADAYVGPHADAPLAFVVDQIDPATGAFDEHKILLGFRNRGHAKMTYCGGFSDGSGSKRIGALVAISIPALKAWLSGEGALKPIAYQPRRR